MNCKSWQRCIIGMIMAVVIWAAIPINGFAAIQGDIVRLTVLTVNDFHGALADKGVGKDPGGAKLAAFLLRDKGMNPSGTLLLSAGDMFQGSVDSNLLYGKPVIELMNYIGFDALALGNHEFDWGLESLREMRRQSRFSWGAVNVNERGRIPDFAMPAHSEPFLLMEREGLLIGIIPLATPETTFKTNPKFVGNFSFEEPAAIVKEFVPVLRQRGAQVIIVLSHLSSYQDSGTKKISGEAADLANSLPEGYVDLIVSGHSHQSVAGVVNGIAVVQALYNGRQAGEVNLHYSLVQKKVVEVLPVVVDLSTREDLQPDNRAAAIIEKYCAAIAEIKHKVLGKSAQALEHNHFGGSQSLLGQWVTDTMKEAAGVDFAFQNGGGLRAGLAAGDITVGNLYEVLPFDNTISTVELTGRQIVEVLDYGIRNMTYGMLQFSGANVIYDPEKPAGERVVSVILPDGSPLIADKVYKVATNDFMAAGGDGYTMFRQGRSLIETGVAVRDCLKEAVQKDGVIKVVGDARLVFR